MSNSERRRRENGGAVGVDKDRGGAHAVGMNTEAPTSMRVTEAGRPRSRSRSERRGRENGGTVGAESDRGEANAVGEPSGGRVLQLVVYTTRQ